MMRIYYFIIKKVLLKNEIALYTVNYGFLKIKSSFPSFFDYLGMKLILDSY